MDEQIPTLAAMFAEIPDPRKQRGRRHPWSALLLVIVAGLLSGANSQRGLARWSRDAGSARRRRLGFTRRRGPSRATVNRVLYRVDVAALEERLGAWLQRVRAAWAADTARGPVQIDLHGVVSDGDLLDVKFGEMGHGDRDAQGAPPAGSRSPERASLQYYVSWSACTDKEPEPTPD